MLPLGIRTLPQIEAEQDLARRVRDAGVLLKYLLANFEPDATDDHGRRDLDLVTRVKRNERLFADGLPDVLHAVQAGEAVARGEPLLDEAKQRAAATLVHAARLVLPHLSDDLCREIHGTPPEPQKPRGHAPGAGDQTETLTRAALLRDLMSFARLVVFAVIAGAVVVGAVKLPGLLAETPADMQARQVREQATREAVARKEADNATRADIGVLVEQARNAEAIAKEFVKETERFAAEVEPLLTSDPGKLIAADPTGVETIVALLDRSRPTKEDASRLVQRISRDLVSPLAASLKQTPPLRPDPSRATQIESAAAEAQAGVAAYRELRLAFEALLAEGKKSGRTPADKTLAAVIEEARHKHFLDEQHAIQAAAQKQRDASAARLAEAERAKAEAAASVQEEKQRAEAAAAEREAERVRAAAEADRLRAKAKNPEVVKRYTQFLGTGRYCLPQNQDKHGWTYRIESNLSYKSMLDHQFHTDVMRFAAFGAKLNWDWSVGEATVNGWAAKASHQGPGSYDYRANDRAGRWKYPATQAELQAVRQLQREFFELAPYWVEQGKLSP